MQEKQTTNHHTKSCCQNHGCCFGDNDKCDVYLGKALPLLKCGEASVCANQHFLDEEYPDYN